MLKKVCENVIKSRNYDKEDMQLKLDVFWAASKITTDEYDYLCGLMVEYPPITETV